MRIVRVFTGVLLLTVGIPALLAGAVLGADLTLDLRAELRAGWTAPVTTGLLAGGVLFVASALLLLLRPVRPREVVFVVEPDQVPVLAGRLGVTSLSGLGAQPTRDGERAVAPVRQLASVGAPLDRPRPALGPVPASRPATGPEPAGRPATLADLVGRPDGCGPDGSGEGSWSDGRRDRAGRDGTRCVAPLRPSEVDLSLAWPPATRADVAPPEPTSRTEPVRPAGRVAPGERALRPESPSRPESGSRPERASRREPSPGPLRPAVPADPTC